MREVGRSVISFLIELARIVASFAAGSAVGFLAGLVVDLIFPPPTPAQTAAAPLTLFGGIVGAIVIDLWWQRVTRRSN